jgi:AcrR family transcriptional regulator
MVQLCGGYGTTMPRNFADFAFHMASGEPSIGMLPKSGPPRRGESGQQSQSIDVAIVTCNDWFMNRSVDQLKRAKLLARIVDYALQSGVTSLTLRPTATAVGTSARMLVHHFGSRDAMAAEVLSAVEARLVSNIAAGPAQATAEAVMRQMWRATGEPQILPLVRAVFEAWGRALVRPGEFGDYLQRVFTPWRDALAAALEAGGDPPDAAQTKATLAMAAFNGLQLVRLTTGDEQQANAAFDLMSRQVLEPRSQP